MKHNFADNRLFVDLKQKYVPEQENLKYIGYLIAICDPGSLLKSIKFNVHNYKKKNSHWLLLHALETQRSYNVFRVENMDKEY